MARYADDHVNYREYDGRIRKLLDTHIGANDVQPVTPLVNIFNENMVADALAHYGEDKQSVAAKADTIAHNLKRSITENLEKDESFYKPFSKMVEETIATFHQGRIDEREYLQRVLGIQRDLESGETSGMPAGVQGRPEARAFFGVLKDTLVPVGDATAWADRLGGIALEVDALIRAQRIRDWHRNLDVQRAMENVVEDLLIQHPELFGGTVDYTKLDAVLLRCMQVARANY